MKNKLVCLFAVLAAAVFMSCSQLYTPSTNSISVNIMCRSDTMEGFSHPVRLSVTGDETRTIEVIAKYGTNSITVDNLKTGSVIDIKAEVFEPYWGEADPFDPEEELTLYKTFTSENYVVKSGVNRVVLEEPTMMLWCYDNQRSYLWSATPSTPGDSDTEYSAATLSGENKCYAYKENTLYYYEGMNCTETKLSLTGENVSAMAYDAETQYLYFFTYTSESNSYYLEYVNTGDTSSDVKSMNWEGPEENDKHAMYVNNNELFYAGSSDSNVEGIIYIYNVDTSAKKMIIEKEIDLNEYFTIKKAENDRFFINDFYKYEGNVYFLCKIAPKGGSWAFPSSNGYSARGFIGQLVYDTDGYKVNSDYMGGWTDYNHTCNFENLAGITINGIAYYPQNYNGFYGPTRIVAIKNKELVIEDYGIIFESATGKLNGGFVTFNLQNKSLSYKTSNIRFGYVSSTEAWKDSE